MTTTIWIDHQQALVTSFPEAQRPTVERITRRPSESEDQFDARVVDAVIDRPRVEVTGPAFARTRFERAYVAVTHRPDRLHEPATEIHDDAAVTLVG